MFEIEVIYLAIVTSFINVSDEGSIPEIAQYGPDFIPLNVLTASKGPNLYISLLYVVSV